MTQLHVSAIPTDRLEVFWTDGIDDLGTPIKRWPTEGWEPLRCCLRTARGDDDIALISYRPLVGASPWSEVGPVFIHRVTCPGYPDTTAVPAEWPTGSKVLRTYRADGSMDYDDITLVAAGEDVEPALHDLLSRPEVCTVHVRSQLAQCFGYAVTAG